MPTCKTVTIATDNGPVVINETAFNPDVHVLYGEHDASPEQPAGGGAEDGTGGPDETGGDPGDDPDGDDPDGELEVKHRGGGKYFVMRGDVVVSGPFGKAEAESQLEAELALENS